jgi:hypothetical protein
MEKRFFQNDVLKARTGEFAALTYSPERFYILHPISKHFAMWDIREAIFWRAPNDVSLRESRLCSSAPLFTRRQNFSIRSPQWIFEAA